MKNLKKILVGLIVVAILPGIYISCGGDGGGGAAEEPTEFDVVLTAIGSQKIAVIKENIVVRRFARFRVGESGGEAETAAE